jgi:hypothetical protein
MVLAVLRRVAAHPAGMIHDRLMDLLARLDGTVLGAALVAARAKEHLPARVVLDLLVHPAIQQGAPVARALLEDPDGAVRQRAYRLLFGRAPGPAEFENLLRQAFDDHDPRVVETALAEGRSGAQAAVRALGQFLGHSVEDALVPSQVQALAILASAASPAARAAMVAALAIRGRAWDRVSRLISKRLAEELERLGDAASLTAARSWRRSPAGLLSLVLRERLEAA